MRIRGRSSFFFFFFPRGAYFGAEEKKKKKKGDGHVSLACLPAANPRAPDTPDMFTIHPNPLLPHDTPRAFVSLVALLCDATFAQPLAELPGALLRFFLGQVEKRLDFFFGGFFFFFCTSSSTSTGWFSIHN